MNYFQEKLYIEPAAPAMVMAIGIFLIGVLPFFPQIDSSFGEIFAIGLLILWLMIVGLFMIQGRRFIKKLILEPIRSFAIGSWIASTAVLLQVTYLYFPSYKIY